jgi:hypothetical protein
MRVVLAEGHAGRGQHARRRGPRLVDVLVWELGQHLAEGKSVIVRPISTERAQNIHPFLSEFR